MKKLYLRRSSALAALAAGLMATSAQAQEGQSAEPDSDSIIVTALKRSQSVDSVPQAISVVGGDSLETLGVENVADLANVMPGVNIGRGRDGVDISIRGVTTTDTTSKGEQGIGFNVDGVYVGRPYMQGVAFFDIDRVEVLRGPQGTLYGKSTTGGAINVITRAPEFEFSGYARAEVGNFDTRRLEGAINIPLSGSIAFRAAGSYNHRDGFLETASGNVSKAGQNDYTGRFSLLAELGDRSRARFTLTLGHIGGSGPSPAVYGNWLNGETNRERRTILDNPFPSQDDEDFINFNGEVNLGLGPLDLTYVGAHTRFDSNQLRSTNNDPGQNFIGQGPFGAYYGWSIYQSEVRTDQHELRLTNANPGFIDYVIGGNYFNENIAGPERYHTWTAPVANPTNAASINGLSFLVDTTHESWGIFGQATVNLTEDLSVVAGLRYSDDRVARTGTVAIGPGAQDAGGNVCIAPEPCVGGPNVGSQQATKLTYRGGINYQLTNSDLLYASIATGFKAGGFNDFDPIALTAAPYDPESMTAYELGYKGRIIDGVRFNSNFFYYDYSGSQITSLVNILGNFVIYTQLVPTEIYGWENELSAAIGPDTNIALTASLMESSYTEFQAGLFRNVDWSGLSLDRTPRFVATLDVNHSWDVGRGYSLEMRAFSKLSSGYVVSDFVNAFRLEQGSYTRSDASLTLFAPDDAWYAQLFVRNIENGLQAVAGPADYNPNLLNGTTVPISEPRALGVRVGFNF